MAWMGGGTNEKVRRSYFCPVERLGKRYAMAVARLTGERLDEVNKSSRCGCVSGSPNDWGMVWSAGVRMTKYRDVP